MHREIDFLKKDFRAFCDQRGFLLAGKVPVPKIGIVEGEGKALLGCDTAGVAGGDKAGQLRQKGIYFFF